MIKAISTYFPAITREEKERKELKDKQDSRALTEMHTKVASEITIAVNDVIIIDDYDVGDAVIDSVRDVLAQLEPTTTSIERTAAKRHPNIKRPCNWRDIYRDYQIYRDASLTIDKYGLFNLNLQDSITLIPPVIGKLLRPF
jgi:hypothetical protein